MKKSIKLLFFTLIFTFSLISCSSDDGPVANVVVKTSVGSDDFDADVLGDGGSITKSYSWNNSLTTVDYSMDITSTSGGTFQLVIKDLSGLTVLDKTLNGNVEPDSYSGVSAQGEAGEWTIIVTLTNFNGDGSFSISEGN